MMADDNQGWSTVPSGAVPLQARYAANDAAIQQQYPQWPTGGTAAQIGIESAGNNTAVSPKGATGIAQIMPDTMDAISRQIGKKLDIHNIDDQMFAHRYLMAQNLGRTDGDINGALSLYNSGRAIPDHPETINYVNNFNSKMGQHQGVQSNDGWAPSGPPPTQQASNEWAPSSPPPQQPDNNGIIANLKAAGMQGLNLGAAGIETPAILGAAAIGGIQRAFQGMGVTQNLQQTMANVNKDYSLLSPERFLNKYGVDTSNIDKTTVSKTADAVMNYMMNTLPQQLAAAGTSNSPFFAAQTLTLEQQKAAVPAIQLGELAAPFLHRGAGIEGAPADVAGKLAEEPANEAAAPSAEQPTEPGPIPYRQYFQQPDLFGEEGTGEVGPEGPTFTGRTQFGEENPTPDVRGGLSNNRQMSLQLDQGETLRVSPEGEVFPESATGYRDQMSARVADFNEAVQRGDVFTQGDLFNDLDQRRFDQFAGEANRELTPKEFGETVTNLASTEGTRFEMPADMEEAYGKYLETVRDDQGGLFDRPTIAKNFVDSVRQLDLDRRLDDHPIVKRNQGIVDQLQAALEAAQGAGQNTTTLRTALDRAQDTLDKSQENIGKALGDDPRLPKAGPDGTVNMYTFGYMPELMRSIGAILKGLHGIVFKSLDRVLPNFKNLDSTAKLFGQGIKNFVNKEANRDWTQTVNAKPIAQLSKIPGMRSAVDSLNPHAQDDLSPAELKNQFNTAPDISGSKLGNFLRSNLLQGGLMLSDFTNHPLVKYATDNVAKAFRSADKWARENLLNKETGLGPMIKQMPLKDFTEIRSLMETFEGRKEFTEQELKNRGFNDKQIEYYRRSVELQKEALNRFNSTRQLLGLAPVDARVAHIAGYFTGDFRQIVKDSVGRVVAVLGHNNRFALSAIAKRFQELHPDGANLDMGKPTLNRGVGRGDNAFHGFMNILNELSKTNADVDRIVQAYRDVQSANTNRLNQMANRAKFKRGPENRVGGAEGQKVWQSMQQNAIDGGKQQLKYLDSVNRWSELAQALNKTTKFINDPEVNAPNAKAVAQRYLDDQMHRNMGDLAKFTDSFMNGVADITGVGPTQMRGISSLTKVGLLNMFVGLGKLSHSLVTFIQPALGIPMVNSVIQARGGILGPHYITAVLKSMGDNFHVLQQSSLGKPISDPFLRSAYKYAIDNDTFNTSQFNMGTVAHQPTKLGTVLHINVTVPESSARAFTYLYYTNLLKDTAKGSMTDQEIFGAAHNATQKVMADYNREAQAPIYGKLGFLGDLTRMLTTFKMNQISQFATASKMLGQGKFGPMMTMMGSSLAAAGLRGFIGYNIANGLIGQLTTWATQQGLMKQPTNLDQIILHMMHGMNPHLADVLNFGATSALGIDMTGSLSHTDDIPNDPLGTLIPEAPPIAKMISSGARVMEQPNSHNLKALAYDVAPNAFKGIMENTMFTDSKGNYYDPHTGNLVNQRSATDQALRAATFRPLDESKMRLAATVGAEQNEMLATSRSGIEQRMLSDVASKGPQGTDLQKYAQEYFNAGGDPQELINALVKHQGINKALNVEQREAGIPSGNFTSAERYQRAQELK